MTLEKNCFVPVDFGRLFIKEDEFLNTKLFNKKNSFKEDLHILFIKNITFLKNIVCEEFVLQTTFAKVTYAPSYFRFKVIMKEKLSQNPLHIHIHYSKCGCDCST